MEYYTHSTSIVDEGATIGARTKIWHWTHICAGATIGNDCTLGQNVYVGNDVTIGSNVKVQNNVSIYDGVILEDDVFCGPSMVFTNVNNPRSFLNRKSEFRKTVVKKGASIGANSTIVCGVTIGEYAFIAAGAVVKKDVKAYSIMAGVPAKQIGWMSQWGETLDLPIEGSCQITCKKTGKLYILNCGELKCKD
jgi:UDP-2-acetamido-3-amino-2,3-dideoxy-glucuronate N-acetyltransferase